MKDILKAMLLSYAVKFFLQILIGIAQFISSGSNATQCFSMNSSSLMDV
jgi:hypothetical protein